jgi:hypothetical protein
MKYTLLVFMIAFVSMAATAQQAQTDSAHGGNQSFVDMVNRKK